MKNNPLITILLPAYNAEKYIEKALFSIMNQTYQNLEILVLNDGSTDETEQIILSLQKKDKRIRYVKNEINLKLIKTLNKGIELATGEYIARMDADDISLPLRIEKQLSHLQKNNLDLVDCQIIYRTEQGQEIKNKAIVPTTNKSLQFYALFKTPLLHPTILCKANVLKDNHYLFDEKTLHCEDYELWTRLLQKNYNIQKIKEPLYIQQVNAESVSNKYEDVQIENFIYLSNQNYAKVLDKKIDFSTWKYCINRFQTIDWETFSKTVKTIKEIQNQYIKTKKINSLHEKKEIEAIVHQQLLDINIQAIKKTKSIRFILNLLFTKSLYNSFSYFLSKF